MNDILGMIALPWSPSSPCSRSMSLSRWCQSCPSCSWSLASSTTKHIRQYRRASRKASGIVTGFIGEFFGAVQAVKVATAEDSVLRHFNEINNTRRKVVVRERLFNTILGSLFRNAVDLGTGMILILAGQAMVRGTFTVGDFSLFVFMLGGISELTTFSGLLVARYKQISVSVERMSRLMEGAPPEALTEPGPVYLDGKLPEVIYPEKTPEDRLELLEVKGLTYRYPSSENGIEDISLCLRPGTLTVITGRIGRARRHCCGLFLGCYRVMPAKYSGMGHPSRMQAPGSHLHDVPTRRRCHACSAIRCVTIS